MPIVVREADLVRDRQTLVDFLLLHLTPRFDGARFEWLYLNCPYGPAKAWLAWDSGTNTLVGVAAAFPREMWVGGNLCRGWVLGDFCIHSGYRSLGPAMQLQRACMAPVESGKVGFFYDFPSQGMVAIYRRMGIHPGPRMVRFMKPLRLEEKVKTVVPSAAIAKPLGWMADRMLALRDRFRQSYGGVDVEEHDRPFGDEFSRLDRPRSSFSICGSRTSAFLTWRYLANPVRHRILAARRNSHLCGYAAFTVVTRDVEITDMQGEESPGAVLSLLSALSDVSRSAGADRLSVCLSEAHPYIPLLSESGFFRREGAPIVTHHTPAGLDGECVYDDKEWCLMQGDRDS